MQPIIFCNQCGWKSHEGDFVELVDRKHVICAQCGFHIPVTSDSKLFQNVSDLEPLPVCAKHGRMKTVYELLGIEYCPICMIEFIDRHVCRLERMK